MVIEENNLSVAWGRAFLEVIRAPRGEISPLVVVINDLNNADPPEIPAIRNALDAALREDKKGISCDEVANTIFPSSLWNPEMSRECLYERYLRIFDNICRHRKNWHGVYFQRLISFGYDKKTRKRGVNQLEQIIKKWEGGNHRRSALQASVFDPYNDHVDQRQRGFPCLQQVAFAKTGENGLSVTGFYPTQYVFERAYGNYLGLCRLGRFMAQEMGLSLSQVVCIATPAKLDMSKKDSKELAGLVEAVLHDLTDEVTNITE